MLGQEGVEGAILATCSLTHLDVPHSLIPKLILKLILPLYSPCSPLVLPLYSPCSPLVLSLYYSPCTPLVLSLYSNGSCRQEGVERAILAMRGLAHLDVSHCVILPRGTGLDRVIRAGVCDCVCVCLGVHIPYVCVYTYVCVTVCEHARRLHDTDAHRPVCRTHHH